MSPAHTNNSRWMAPEVAHTIYQRSLAVGILFGAAALALALYPNATLHARFFQAYLLGYMFWLGITLGSMVFLMIQHLFIGFRSVAVLPAQLLLHGPWKSGARISAPDMPVSSHKERQPVEASLH